MEIIKAYLKLSFHMIHVSCSVVDQEVIHIQSTVCSAINVFHNIINFHIVIILNSVADNTLPWGTPISCCFSSEKTSPICRRKWTLWLEFKYWTRLFAFPIALITLGKVWIQLFFLQRGCPRCVMVKTIDCGIVAREFELQSRYYVHFRTNILEKGMNPLILPAMG